MKFEIQQIEEKKFEERKKAFDKLFKYEKIARSKNRTENL